MIFARNDERQQTPGRPGPRALIGGLGLSDWSRQEGTGVAALIVEALQRALDDAGVTPSDVDGVLVAPSPAAGPAVRPWMTPNLARELGLGEVRFLSVVEAEGAGACVMVQLAAMAVASGAADTVVCVFGDAPLTAGTPGGAGFPLPQEGGALNILGALSGSIGGLSSYAMTARLYLERYGRGEDDLAHVALSNREWAGLNPGAAIRAPLTLEEYRASRYVAEPLRVLDCAYPVNGAGVVLVTRPGLHRTDRAVEIAGFGQYHVGHRLAHTLCDDLRTGAEQASSAALRMAGIGLSEVDVFELYDAFTIMTLLSLEGYGVCGRGEAGDYVAAGHTRPGGRTPVSTGGGHTSGGYLQSLTPLAEGIDQARGRAGGRQVAGARGPTVLVSGVGGVMDHHACLILRPAG